MRITLSQPPELSDNIEQENLPASQPGRMYSPAKNKLNFLDNVKNVLGRTRSKETGDDNGCASVGESPVRCSVRVVLHH